MLLQQTGPAVWLEFDFENELAERKDGSRYSSELEGVAKNIENRVKCVMCVV